MRQFIFLAVLVAVAMGGLRAGAADEGLVSLIRAKCTVCHKLDRVQKHQGDDWDAIVTRMRRYGAQVNETQGKAIAALLATADGRAALMDERKDPVTFSWTPGQDKAATAAGEVPFAAAEGTALTDCPVGKAAAPAPIPAAADGRIAAADLKLGTIPETGTISFWIKLDRQIRVAPKGERVEAKLIDCEDLTIYLRENDNGCSINIEGGNELRRPRVRGLAGMDLTHLAADRWYHVAIRYDAPKGLWRMILNGVLQPEPFFFGPFAWRNLTTHLTLAGLMKPTGEQGKPARVTLGPVTWKPGAAEAKDVLAMLKAIGGWTLPPNEGEGVLEGGTPFDGEALGGEVIYRNTFDKPLDMGKEWVLEGPAKPAVEDGRLAVGNVNGKHCVLWLKKELPHDFVAAWDFQPSQVDGLTIVFMAAMGADGRDLFDPTLAKRDGDFNQYIRGDIRCYHFSYWAGTRGSANMRKNPGFYMIGMGPDLIGAAMAAGKKGPFRVVLLRQGNRIECGVDGVRFLKFDEDGKLYGPPHGAGYFGLRQMGHTKLAWYDNLVIRKLKPAE